VLLRIDLPVLGAQIDTVVCDCVPKLFQIEINVGTGLALTLKVFKSSSFTIIAASEPYRNNINLNENK